MAAKDERRIVSLGGKGQSLSSSSAFEVADGVARLIIDSSALSRLSDDTQQKFTFTVPDYLTNEESRASILLLLSKCLLSHKSASVSAVNQLSDILNNPDKAYAVSHSINVKDVTLFDYSAVALDGISVILDFSSSALSAIADAVAAMSCEALKADVSAFNLIDSGDGSTSKDDVSVASDFKVFFNQSKLGKFVDPSISKIPSVHGNFRENSRLLHSRARVELNSGFNGASDKAMSNALSSLAHALCELGEISSRRSKLLFELIPANELLSSIMKSENYSPGESAPLDDLYIASQVTLRKEKDYIKFAHQVYSLSELVRKTICWEALLAFFLLEGGFNKVSIVPNVEETGKPAKKSEKANAEKTGKSAKKSEKKSVMGKGTGAFVQFIKDKLSSAEVAEDDWMRSFISFFDPKFLGFESLMSKVKEIVESNESRRLPKLPKGTRDFAKEQMAIREHAFSIITNVFKRHGATSLDTPVFEMRETLMGKYGEDSKLIYDLADQGGELCSLRYDLTVPFARFVAMNGITSLKRYQIAKVYRRDNPSKGRYREFYQCDFDIAGLSENMGPDFEVIRVLTELLDELNIGDYKVKLNHRKLLDGMLAICGVPQEKFRTICSSIDKLDKQPFDKIKKEMVNEKGLTEEIADKIGMFVKESGPPIELLNKLQQEGSEFNKNSESKLALEELEVLFNTLVKSKCINKVVFDLSLARGLDYYTGVIFEAVFKGDTQVGSIAAGGRYDNLIGMFGTKQVPSVGISLGIERVFAIMEQQEKNQEIRATETQVLVSILSKDDDKALGLSLGAEIVSELWDAKLKAEYLVNGRWTKHTDRAKNSKIPWIVRVDESLISQGKVQLKNVIATEEKDILVERDTLVEELKRRLN